MKLPEVEVADYLSNDAQIVQLMDSLRLDKLGYVPVFTETPDDTFIKASSAPWIRVTPYQEISQSTVITLAFLSTRVFRLTFGFAKRR